MSSRGLVILGIALGLFLGVALPAEAQFGRNKIQYKNLKWQVLTTPHFEFYFYEGCEPFVVRAALIMEDGHRMLSEKLGETLPWRVPVILYGSHNDFLQNNVAETLLPEGVQAFAEPSRKRIVLPFTGSYDAFAHTAVHELAHVFTFQIVYNRLLDNVFSQNYLFPMPLWIAEGVAEYLAVGWDAESDMFIRDAVIHDYLTDLEYAGGFMVYKEGQSALNYIKDTYGEEKVREVLYALGSTRNADIALERTLGLDTRAFSERWMKSLRKHYWPLYGEKTEAEEIGRRLTNHREGRHYYNTKPVMSPDGEKIAYFSDRDGLISIFIMSVVDNRIIKKLVSGYQSSHFESLHFYTSSLAFSPDGEYLAFAAKAKGRDVLYLVDANKGRVRKVIEVEGDEITAPAWSPTDGSICVSANFGGQTDLVLVTVATGEARRLTNDAGDQLNPRFFPDGRRIAFTYFPPMTTPVPPSMNAEARRRLSDMDFLARENIDHSLNRDIYEIDIDTGETRPLITTAGDDDNPIVFDGGRKMVFVSDVSGISNLYLADLERGTHQRITDVLSGIFTPDVNESRNRLTFSAFVDGGYDIFVSDDLSSLLTKRYADDPAEPAEAAPAVAGTVRIPYLAGPDIPVAAAVARKSAVAPDEDPVARPFAISNYSLADEDTASIFEVKSRLPEDGPRAPAEVASTGIDRELPAGPKPPEKPIPGYNQPVSLDEPASKGATVSDYKLKLAPDFIGTGGFYFATGYGFGLANTIALSDILGDHRLIFSFNIQSDIADSDLFASYYYLKRRVNYGIGLFQFRSYFNSPVSSIGESFGGYQLFAERNFGLYGLVSVPFNTFDRLDFQFQAFVSERQFFEQTIQDGTAYYEQTTESTRRLFEPSISFVHDASFYDMFGPVEGSRWTISLMQGVGFSEQDVSRSTLYLDYRKYKRLFYRNSLAFRLAFAASEGTDSRAFFIGGPSTLRGYDYLAAEGTRMALLSLEYRLPLIDALIIGFPGRWGLGNIGGKVFFDAGAAWKKGDLAVFRNDVGGVQLRDALADVGFGVHFYLGYLLLNFQLAWQTDMNEFYASHFTFFIGPAF